MIRNRTSCHINKSMYNKQVSTYAPPKCAKNVGCPKEKCLPKHAFQLPKIKCQFKIKVGENEECLECEDLVRFVGLDCIDVSVMVPSYDIDVPTGCIDAMQTPLSGVLLDKLDCLRCYPNSPINKNETTDAKTVHVHNNRVCRIIIDGQKLRDKLL